MAEKPPEDSPGQEMRELESFLKNLKHETTKRHEQIQELQQRLSEEKDSRKQERFFGILGFLILFNVIVLTPMQTWGGPISILILELIALVLLASRMGLQEASQIIDRILVHSSKRSRGDE